MGFQQLRVIKYICVMFECVWDRKKGRKVGGWVASCGKSKVWLWKCKKIRDGKYWNRKHAKMCFQSLKTIHLWEVTHFAFRECVLTKCPLTLVFVWSVPGLGSVPALNEPSIIGDMSFAIWGQTAASGCHFSSKKQPEKQRQSGRRDYHKHHAPNWSIQSLYWSYRFPETQNECKLLLVINVYYFVPSY